MNNGLAMRWHVSCRSLWRSVRLARAKAIAEPAPVGSISTRRKISLGIGTVLLVSGIGTLISTRSQIEISSVRYLDGGRTAVVRLTNKGDHFVRCAPAPTRSGPVASAGVLAWPWLWPASEVELMPHSSFEFGMKLPQTTKATARIRCAPRPGPTRKFIERCYAAVGVRPPPEGFLIAVDLEALIGKVGAITASTGAVITVELPAK